MSAPVPLAPRYSAWLGLASFAWALLGWGVAWAAPRLALWPGVEALHMVMPLVTVALILLNLGFALAALRRDIRPESLMLVTALQLGLFTTLFLQIACHLGPQHYKLVGPVPAWQWLQFSLAHALKASDLLDVIEAYGLPVQVVKHQGPLTATLVVIYHLVVDLFVLSILWAAVAAVRRSLLAHPWRARRIRALVAGAFLVTLTVWLLSALYFRPWRPIDLLLWVAENVVRVVDIGDAMDSFDIHWHQVPKEPWEATLTFIGRLWIALGVAVLLSYRKKPTPTTPVSFGWALRLSLAGALFGLFLGVSAIAGEDQAQSARALVEVAAEPDEDRARAALAGLRRMGPNAESAAEALAALLDRAPRERRDGVIDTLSSLGPRAMRPLERLALGRDEAEAIRAAAGLGRIGPEAAPLLVRIWKHSPHRAAGEEAARALREQGPEAMTQLIRSVAPDTSAEHLHWFEALDRNWVLRYSDNRTYLAMRHGWTGWEQLNRYTPTAHHYRPYRVRTAEDAYLGIDIGTAAIPALVQAVQDADPEYSFVAYEALGRLGPLARDAGPVLVQALLRPAVWPPLRSVERSSERRPPSGPPFEGREPIKGLPLYIKEARPGLEEIAVAIEQSPRGLIVAGRDHMARSLDAVNSHWRSSATVAEAVPGLALALKAPSADVRFAAAVILGRIGPAAKAARAALVGAATDTDRGVQREAAQALKKLDGK